MDDDIEGDVVKFIRWMSCGIASWLVLLGLAWLLFLLFGCAGARQTAKEPIHAENGAGITIWKIPIIGFGEWGDSNYKQEPNVIVHKYDYTAKPQPTPPRTSPTPPWMPMPTDYPTIYGSAWDDPSLVIFKNESYRRVKIQIDGHRAIVIEPYDATTDIHLGLGEHRVKITKEKQTAAHGVWEEVNIFSIYVSPESRSQIFHIYDW